jgi:hypothetical protein
MTWLDWSAFIIPFHSIPFLSFPFSFLAISISHRYSQLDEASISTRYFLPLYALCGGTRAKRAQ